MRLLLNVPVSASSELGLEEPSAEIPDLGWASAHW